VSRRTEGKSGKASQCNWFQAKAHNNSPVGAKLRMSRPLIGRMRSIP
jgi:hypothetical protein